MDVEAVLLADVQGELADRFQERQAFDVAHRSADLGYDHVDVVAGQLADRRLDLVRDVRNDLDRPAQKIAVTLFFNDGEIDFAGGIVAIPAQGRIGEAFVMSQVQVGFRAVVEDVDLAVLVRAHRPRIDIDVGIEFLQPNAQTSMFQQHANRGARQSFA